MLNNEKNSEDRKRTDLEKLIQQSSQSLDEVTKKAQKVLPRSTDIFLDYGKMKTDLDKESLKMIKNISRFYLNDDVIKNVPYVSEKIKIDTIMASSLLFQMRTAEHAITKLLGEIDSGRVEARNFEVLGQLQRSKMEIIKHLGQYMQMVEATYKNFYEDYKLQIESNTTQDGEEVEDDSGGMRIKGTKQLLKAMQKYKNSDKEIENDKDDNYDEE